METLSLSVVDGVDSRATNTLLESSQSSRIVSEMGHMKHKDEDTKSGSEIDIRDEDFNTRFERSLTSGLSKEE